MLWSLMDNYDGYHGHLGLLGVDRATQRRWIRPSAAVLAGMARAKGFDTSTGASHGVSDERRVDAHGPSGSAQPGLGPFAGAWARQ
jgi:hypothetical protein